MPISSFRDRRELSTVCTCNKRIKTKAYGHQPLLQPGGAMPTGAVLLSDFELQILKR